MEPGGPMELRVPMEPMELTRANLGSIYKKFSNNFYFSVF
jgi:hypothetical protein